MATAGPADHALVSGSSPCKLVPCSDGRHFMFRVDAAAIRRPVGHICKETCEIGNGYTCKASFVVPPILGGNKVILVVTVNGDQAPLTRGHRVFVDMALLDNTKSPILPPFSRSMMSPSAAGSKLPPPVAGSNLAAGYVLAVSRNYLLANCVKDGMLAALCSVVFLPPSLPLPPDSLLAHRLATMSGGQNLTDVCFDIDGEKFNAHRLVMAAQSKVFRAELFGSMAETKMKSITIPDMSPSTFKHMIHYIYCNELPAADDNMDETSRIIELQHLLVAADLYGVENLKELCENTICAGITTDTVISTLELAAAKSFPKLRASCIEFLSDTENFAEVATTQEYYKLIQSYPSVLTEIRNRFKRPRPSPKLTPSTVTEDQNKRPRPSPKLAPSTVTEDQNKIP